MNKVKLSDCGDFSTCKIENKKLSILNYISTDNMLQNKEGITVSLKVPTTLNSIKYEKDDILISNIRPYLKKIWFSDKNGGCSNDVLVFKTNNKYISKYIYYSLMQDLFFEHMMNGSKGTKMSRGDKSYIKEFLIPDIDIEKQENLLSMISFSQSLHFV